MFLLKLVLVSNIPNAETHILIHKLLLLILLHFLTGIVNCLCSVFCKHYHVFAFLVKYSYNYIESVLLQYNSAANI